MTVSQFPFPGGLPNFEMPWTIDAVQYIFHLQWNTRAQLWFLSVADATATAIVSGIALRTGRNLLEPYGSLAIPPGLLLVYDQTGAQADAGLLSFDTSHQLLYVS